jgi:hypothetical protein
MGTCFLPDSKDLVGISYFYPFNELRQKSHGRLPVFGAPTDHAGLFDDLRIYNRAVRP